MSIRVQAISLVALLILATNILGFGREVLTAHAFGTSVNADAFVTAFTIVSMCFLIFSAGAVQGAFMPRYQSLVLEGKLGKAKGLFNYSLTILCWLLLGVIALLMFGADFLVKVIVPGFSPEKMLITSKLIRIMAPMVFLFGIGSLFQSVLHAYQKFIGPALVPVLNNIVIILALLFVVPKLGIDGLAGGVTAGSILWLVVLLPLLLPLLKNSQAEKDKTQFKICLTLIWPLLLLIVVDQISALIQKGLVSGLETGCIAALSYAAKLEGLPIGIFAGAVSTVMFPAIVESASPDKRAELEKKFYDAIELTIALCLPFSFFLCLEGDLIVRVLLQRGAFDAFSTHQTSLALFYYALGLIAQGIIVFVNKVYFALSNTKVPMLVGTCAAIIHVIFCYFAVKYLGYIGVAAGTTLYAFCYALLLLSFLGKTFNFSATKFGPIFCRCLLAMIIMGSFYYFVKGMFVNDLLRFVMIAVSILSFYLSYLLIKNREFYVWYSRSICFFKKST